jgi:hypothetical protein
MEDKPRINARKANFPAAAASACAWPGFLNPMALNIGARVNGTRMTRIQRIIADKN